MRNLLRLSLVAAGMVSVFAQLDQATITGAITDPGGASVPGAKVVLTNIKTGVIQNASANSAGIYSIPYLSPGAYDLSVTANGFQRTRVAGIELTVGLTATINVKLELGLVQSEVTVSATAVQLEQQTSSIGTVVTSAQMREMPLLGRNPYNLVLLAPGVLPKEGVGGSRPIINGGRSNTSEVLLDGAESRNSSSGAIAYTPPLEAVEEFNLVTNGSSAMFGRSGGGVLSVATRSGTNQLHGSLYEFFRNDKLNANSWMSNRLGLPRNAFHRNEYGFSVGGPVLLPRIYNGRNRTFFFTNWEQIPQRTPENIRDTVPTALERMGDFSQSGDRAGGLFRVYDPATTRPAAQAGRYTRDQFPGNRIPLSRLDPVALKVLDYIPLPNRSDRSENYVLNQTNVNDTRRWFTRFDHTLNQKHRLFMTYGRQDSTESVAFVNIAYPGEGTTAQYGTSKNHSFTSVISDTVLFSNNLVGEFRASIVRSTVESKPRSLGFDFTQLGLPQSLKAQAATLVFPRFEIADATAVGPARASFQLGAEQNQQLQGHLTWTRGSHTARSGGDYTFFVLNTTRPNWPSSQYVFGRAFTQGPDPATANANAGDGIATFLLGLPTAGQISSDPSLAASQRAYAWYASDDWKVRRNLTLNLGLRWEYQAPWTDRFNQLAYFDREAIDPATKRKGTLLNVAQEGRSRYQAQPDRNNFSPRIGLAWSVLPKMVIRSSYGVFYFAGSGGIGGGPSTFGDGFLSATPVFLGQPPDAPNTPPEGASITRAFQSGFFPTPTTGVGNAVTTQFRDWITPYTQQWNLSIQRTLGRNILVETAYIGSRGQRIWVNRNNNAVSTDFLSLGADLDRLVPNPFFGQITTGTLSTRTVRQSQLLSPYPHYQGVTRIRDPIGDSVYHGFSLRVEKRLSFGLRMQASYTISKLIDNVQERFGGKSNFFDPNNLKLSRSLADYDRPQVLVLNWIYELPFGPGKDIASRGIASKLLGNWQFSGISTFAPGTPLAITAPNNARLPGVATAAIRARSGVLPEGEQTLDRWFDPNAFLPAPAYTIGNDSRTQPNLRGPGMNSFDLSVSRRQRIREGISLQFRGEFFNAFNTPQFDDPNTAVNSRDFGRVLTAGNGRVVQLALRLVY